MKTIRPAAPAHTLGVSCPRFSASSIPVGKFVSETIASIWKRSAAALGCLAVALSTPASALTIDWDPNPETDISCYVLSYGTQPGVYPNTIDAGTNTSATVSGLAEGTTYYFVLNAVNQAGLQSPPSAEISYQVPGTPPATPAPIPRAGWSLRYVDSEETNGYAATYAIDDNPGTFWHTAWRTAAPPPPHEIQIDLGAVYAIQGFRYLPRQDNTTVGNIAQYEFFVSMDGSNWGAVAAAGTFATSSAEKEALFATRTARYVRLRSLTVADGGACNVAELNILGSIATNHAPTANSITVTTTENTPLPIVLAASDADNNTLAYSIVSGPAHGALSGTAPNVTYTPAANYSGADSFTFKASDGTADSAVATVSLSVTPVNHAPVFACDPINLNTTEETALTGQLLASDADAGDALTFSKVSGPAWLAVASNGALSGTPPAGSAGLNTFVVRATDRSSATADAELRITVAGGLPLPWTTGDIGTGQLAGTATCTAGTFTQGGSGAFGGTSDKLRFTYQTLSGDGEIIAMVGSLQNTGTSSRVGVMIRDTLATNSKFLFMGMTGSNAYRWARRTTTGGNTSTTNSNTGTVPNTWLRLVRSGSTITAYKGANGTTWTKVGSTTVTLATNCYIGLAVASGSNTTLNTSQFGKVSVTP